jgi:hypothetical protein
MGEATFNCDRCGKETPQRQLKEAFVDGDGNDRSKQNLCPECLDEVMNASQEVRGVPGEEKRAAVAIDQGAEADPIRRN